MTINDFYLINLGTAAASVLVTYFTLRNTDQMSLRKEMWDQITELKDQVRLMQTEMDDWRNKYTSLKIENGGLILEIKALKTQMEFVQDQWKNLDAGN